MSSFFCSTAYSKKKKHPLIKKSDIKSGQMRCLSTTHFLNPISAPIYLPPSQSVDLSDRR
eukprot:c10227_g1_i1 orf=21-200(+)